MKLRVFAAPQMILPEDLTGATAVVIDALRMTSVAAFAKQNGCAGLLAVAEVDEARAIAAREGALLGGERGALRIEGFDCANSPLEYTPERMAGQRLVMTTSNGTRAILAARNARRVLLGAFVNAAAVAKAARGADTLALICAGTLGAFTLEDALAAGAIAKRCLDANMDARPDDMTLAVLTLYEAARGDLHAALRETEHYGRLLRLGLSADLDVCLREDTLLAVPERAESGWFQ